jgi:Tol biopolymer transport system component
MSCGFLTTLDQNDGEPHILDHETQFYGAAISPDGMTIAYDNGGSDAFLYRQDIGRQPFEPENFGLVSRGHINIANASWSPDGKLLAWIVAGRLNDNNDGFALTLFDLKKRTAQLLHVYQIAGTDVWPSAAIWSPDGRWVAYDAVDEDNDRRGLWAAKVDEQTEFHLIRNLTSMAWSPDSRWLAFTTYGEDSGNWIAEVGTWRTQQLALPRGAEVVDWVTLPK